MNAVRAPTCMSPLSTRCAPNQMTATVEALKGESPVPLIWTHAPRPGVATARNTGLAATQAPLIAFLDDDEAAVAAKARAVEAALNAQGLVARIEDLNAVEDYDVYLRLAKDHPVGCHPGVMAEYRQHGSNMTGDPLRMLSAGIEVLKSIDIPRGNRRLRAARRAGLDFMRRRHGLAFFRKIVAGAKGGRPFRDTMRDAVTLMLLVPPTTFTSFDSALACYRLIRVVPYESYGFRQRA